MCFACAIALLGSACGSEDGSGAQQTPTMPGTAAAIGSTAAAGTGSPTARATSSGQPGAAGGTAPGTTTASAPSPGRYIYGVTGRDEGPQGGTSTSTSATVAIARPSETDIRYEILAPSGARTNKIVRWTESQALLSRERTRVKSIDRDCKYSPPLLLARFPLVEGSYEPQRFSESPTCRGTLRVTVLGTDTIEDAGKTWNVRLIKREWLARFSAENNVSLVETAWFAPAQGIDVRLRRVQRSTVGGQRYTSDSTWRLRTISER
jgi:hypothetical protein